MSGVNDGSWVATCTTHVTHVDETCLRDTTNVNTMMDCVRSVKKP
jgi:hypothetical protein